MAYSGVDSGYPDWERLEGVLADTGDTVDWMVSNGIEFDSTPYAMSSSYPMTLANGGGAGLINMLVDACAEKGIELMLNTKGTSLITDDAGAVVGAVAETEDSIITFHAGSVILATGGISRTKSWSRSTAPS